MYKGGHGLVLRARFSSASMAEYLNVQEALLAMKSGLSCSRRILLHQ